MVDPIVPPNASLPAMLAVWRPTAWLILFAASVCFASFGLWGIADRELRERVTASSPRLAQTLEGVRGLAALVGTLAVLTMLFAGLALPLGTWIS